MTNSRWLLEYDSATFAAYINTLQRQHFLAANKTSGPRKYLHDWFNCPSAAQLVEASQARVSRPKVLIEGTASTLIPDGEEHHESNTTTNGQTARDEFAEEMEAVHELEERRDRPMGGSPIAEEECDEVMEEFATQMETVPPNRLGGSNPNNDDGDGDDDELREVSRDMPPVFRPPVFSLDTDLGRRVAERVRKGHEPVLEEQPKWNLLARVLKEIEDTIARVSDSHAGGFMR